LSRLRKLLGIRLIIIIDNCRIYKSDRIREIYQYYQYDFEFLSLYCLYLNSIEASFYDLKTYIRRYYKLADNTYSDFERFFAQVLRDRGRGPYAAKYARVYFRYAEYLGILFEEEFEELE